jgi:hypothetical protein
MLLDSTVRSYYIRGVRDLRLLYVGHDATPIINGFIVGSAGTCFWTFCEAQVPFSGISAGFYVPNVIRLRFWEASRVGDIPA